MDQDSTKDGTGGGDRRNWRERLGVGQDLPKISDEFKSTHSDAKPTDGDAGSDAASGEPSSPAPEPSSPTPEDNRGAMPPAQSTAPSGRTVARPAPMAPRYARSTAPRPGNGSPSGTEAKTPESGEAPRTTPAAPGLRAWATPARPAGEPGKPSTGRPGTGKPPSSGWSTSGAQRSGQAPAASPAQGAQSPAPDRGPSAYAQAAGPRSGAAPSATGGDSFGERLRAQREAAERLAQQRLAAAREKSGRSSADTLTMAPPPRPDAVPPKAAPAREPNAPAKPAGEQPRFTFAEEEIAAAQQETAFTAAPPAAAGNQQAEVPVPQPNVHADAVPAAPPEARREPDMQPSPEPHAAGAPESREQYRHEDDGMFEDEEPGHSEQPELRAVPPRASAADYSAAYREFEDEFEEEPRRGSGPMLLMVSLAAVVAAAGGLVYWYQQQDSAPPAATADLPVISAPEEPAKAEPTPQQQPQEAVQPAARKQIYDRIIGEETLEPERIVPTEEEPQSRPSQRTEEGLPPPASGASPDEAPDAAPDAARQSTEPLPMPLPPPPGTGEQGDLLVPGMANTQTASAEPEPEPEPAQLSFPEPGATSAASSSPTNAPTAPRDSIPTESVQAGSGDIASPDLRPTARAGLRDTTTAPEAGPVASADTADTAAPASIYPEPTVPLPYAGAASETAPPHDRTSEPDEGAIAALPEPEAEADAQEADAQFEPVAEPAAELMAEPDTAAEVEQVAELEPEAQVAPVEEVEPVAEQASDVPLPRAKPEPPAGFRTAVRQAPEPQPQRQPEPQPSGSGPVQIIPTEQSSGQALSQTRAVQQPQAQSPRRPTLGREFDPLEGQRSSFSRSSSLDSGAEAQRSSQSAASQQVARVAPDSGQAQAQPSGGYVVQLSSFRSEAEALNEYNRLVQRHPQLVGELGSRVQEASLGQNGSFYRLGVGPLPNRNTAAKLCNDLIAAGEKDCLVRRR